MDLDKQQKAGGQEHTDRWNKLIIPEKFVDGVKVIMKTGDRYCRMGKAEVPKGAPFVMKLGM